MAPKLTSIGGEAVASWLRNSQSYACISSLLSSKSTSTSRALNFILRSQGSHVHWGARVEGHHLLSQILRGHQTAQSHLHEHLHEHLHQHLHEHAAQRACPWRLSKLSQSLSGCQNSHLILHGHEAHGAWCWSMQAVQAEGSKSVKASLGNQ